MANQQSVTQPQAGLGSPQAVAQRSEPAIRPDVDVFETADGITLNADMPGVSKDHLHLQVEGNTLTVEGEMELPATQNMDALYADVRSTRYRASFVLSSELDSSRVDANLKDGVLTVHIPKRAELRPRRIEVKSS
jgi:HSP20 family molecular chaperone IbpA